MGGNGKGRRNGVMKEEVEERGDRMMACIDTTRLACQEAIQSGRFSSEQPSEEGVRRFLAYDMTGFITSRKEAYGYSIEVRGLTGLGRGRLRGLLALTNN